MTEAFEAMTKERPIRAFGALMLLILPSFVLAQGNQNEDVVYKFKAIHKHVFGSCAGDLIIKNGRVVFDSMANPRDSRSWRVVDLQRVEVVGQDTLSVFSYEDSAAEFGGNREFRFKIEGAKLGPVQDFVNSNIRRAALEAAQVSSFPIEVEVEHKHNFGSCQGKLLFKEDRVVFQSYDRKQDSRSWKYSDLRWIDRPSSYEISIKSNERATSSFGRQRDFDFRIKGAGMPDASYELVADKIK
jgi:hypothetical protein